MMDHGSSKFVFRDRNSESQSRNFIFVDVTRDAFARPPRPGAFARATGRHGYLPIAVNPKANVVGGARARASRETGLTLAERYGFSTYAAMIAASTCSVKGGKRAFRDG
jgi:hypothetical protein